MLDDFMGVEAPASRRSSVFPLLASRWRFIALVQAADFSAFFVVTDLWLRTLSPPATARLWLLHALVSLLAGAMGHCVFWCLNLYDIAVMRRGREAACRAFAAGLLCGSPFLALLLIYAGIPGERVAIACLLVAGGTAGAAAARLGLAAAVTFAQRSGFLRRRIYIVADGAASAASLRRILERSPENEVVGTWDMGGRGARGRDAGGRDASGRDGGGRDGRVGAIEPSLEGAFSFLRATPVDVVILKLPLSEPDRLLEAVRVLRRLPRKILLSPSFDGGRDIELTWANRAAARSGELGDIVTVGVSDRPLAGWPWVMKDVQDRAIALLLLIATLPLLLAIALTIKLADPGPVMFRQKRFGFGGNTFDIIKFRTMRMADDVADPKVLKLATRDDPRVFPAGRLLRRTSLDELPQLLNVLKGDMWIVGPRPHSPLAQAGGLVYAKAVQEYAARYRLKPGITGWAQVCGWRGPTDTLEQLSKRVEHDLYYIERWSTLFDARILFMTLLRAFGHKNAF